MRLRTLLLSTLAGAALVGCRNDVDVTDPNAPSSGNFWRTATDAGAGVTASYNALLRLGTFQRWQAFSYDTRSDVGTTNTSPWAELNAFSKFQFPSGYDFDINRDTWNETYLLINRANLVLANVPGIDMDATRKATYLAEAKFLRGLAYFHLITLYGAQVPLITTPPSATDRPASSDSATVFAQIEKDFTEAAAALPRQLTSQAGGRATAGAAQGMLGKTLLQERKWTQASAALAPVVAGTYGGYSLVPSYATLFTQGGNNSAESLFEVQMGNVDLCGQGLCGLNIAKMAGACGPGYCDGRPTRWYLQQFFLDSTTTGQVDPRLDATLFYYKGPNTPVYARTWAQWQQADPGNYNDTTRIYFKKYGEYYTGSNDQTWEAQINYKVLRYADVLLMQAEALNEQGQTSAAIPLVNQVRARAGLRPLATSLSQAAAARRDPQGAAARVRARGAAVARPRPAEPVRRSRDASVARHRLQHVRRREVAAVADPAARTEPEPERATEPGVVTARSRQVPRALVLALGTALAGGCHRAGAPATPAGTAPAGVAGAAACTFTNPILRGADPWIVRRDRHVLPRAVAERRDLGLPIQRAHAPGAARCEGVDGARHRLEPHATCGRRSCTGSTGAGTSTTPPAARGRRSCTSAPACSSRSSDDPQGALRRPRHALHRRLGRDARSPLLGDRPHGRPRERGALRVLVRLDWRRGDRPHAAAHLRGTHGQPVHDRDEPRAHLVAGRAVGARHGARPAGGARSARARRRDLPRLLDARVVAAATTDSACCGCAAPTRSTRRAGRSRGRRSPGTDDRLRRRPRELHDVARRSRGLDRVPREGLDDARAGSATCALQRFGWHADGSPDFGTPVPVRQPLPAPSGECR